MSSTSMLDTPIVVTPEAKLAHEFIGVLVDLRSPWATLYENWADGKGLSPEMRRAVRLCVLKIRTFGAIQRSARRRR